MKTLKTCINESIFESVFDVDTYTDIKTRKPIFGTLSEVEIQGDSTVYIKCLDNSKKVRFECKNQKAFDEVFGHYGVKKWVINCEKSYHNWGGIEFKKSNKWNFRDLTIELPDFGRTIINGSVVSNLILDIKAKTILDGDLTINSKGGILTINNCNMTCYRAWLDASEFHLNNTTIKCLLKDRSDAGCFVSVPEDSQIFQEIAEEIFAGGPVKDPLKRFGLEGIDAITIDIQRGYVYKNGHIYIGKVGKHKPYYRTIVSEEVLSEDGKYVLHVNNM